MKTTLLTAAAAVALLSGGAALAQTAAPAAPKPAAQPAAPPVAATPPAATPPAAGVAGSLVAKGDIVETLKASGQFTVLLRGLDETNLTSLIKSNKNLTLFAPTDAAFAALPAGELQRLEANPQEFQKVLTYHLINAPVDSSKVKGAKGDIATVAGPQITLDGSGDAIMAGNATITQADVKATNGIVHVVDKVLMPTGTPVATNMTTDIPQGRVIRASWQAPNPTANPATDKDPMTDPAEAPSAAPPADPMDAMGEAAQPATPAVPADPRVAPATPATPATSVAAASAEPAQVTNGPVLDTAENRAKYPPQSRAGKRTAARGN